MIREKIQLHSLQQARGIAAMAVLAFHLSLALGSPRYLGQDIFSTFTRRGNLGVDFFFVLSGFIIAFAHARDIGHSDRLGNYLMRRFVRLFPVYWLYVGIFCSLVAMGFGTAVTLPDTAGQWISTVFLIRLDSMGFPIAPAWTLVHEVAFYLVFALLIASGRGGRIGKLVFVLWMLACLLLGSHPDYDKMTPWTTYFSPLNLNFLIGMTAYYAWVHGKPFWIKSALPAGIAALIGVYLLESHGVPYNVLQLAYAAAFGLIIAGAAALESAGQWPSMAATRLLDLTGNASYTIYLTHEAFLGLIAKIMIRLSAYVALPPKLIYIIVFLGTVACGCILHKLVEVPLIRFCGTYFAGRRKMVSA